MLKVRGVEDEEREVWVERLARDYRAAELEEADRVMLDYVVKLTRTPGEISRGDLMSLREHGFGDRALHDICAVTAYYAFVNRIADGLGVELEQES